MIVVILKVKGEIFSETNEHNYFKCKHKSSGPCMTQQPVCLRVGGANIELSSCH